MREAKQIQHLAVDFGSTNTLVARWNGYSAECMEIPELTVREPTWNTPQVPSVIYFLSKTRACIGFQALSAREIAGAVQAYGQKNWSDRVKPVLLRDGAGQVAEIDGEKVTARQAALLFIETLLAATLQHMGPTTVKGWRKLIRRLLRAHPITQLTMTVPIECHEPYRRELGGMAARLGIRRFMILDEPVAAAMGYGVDLSQDRTILVLDFGGGTLNAAVVQTHAKAPHGLGNHSSVLAGRGLIDFGGKVVDEWVFEELVKRLPSGRNFELLARSLAEEAKIYLSQDNVKAPFTIPISEGVCAELTRQEFETLLIEKGLYDRIDQVLEQTLDDLWLRHQIPSSGIEAVLPVGGSTLLPQVRQRLMERFGVHTVWWDSPFDAVVKGAAVFGAGALVDQIVHHDYAMRLYNEKANVSEYELLAPRGTRYPTTGSLASRYYTLGAGQTEFRLPIYEVGYSGRRSVPWLRRNEGLYWTPESEREDTGIICLNAGEIVRVSPPGDGKRPRLRIEFAIDEQRHLIVTITDLLAHRTIKKEERVVQLR